jgi:hypothetical protein
MTTRIHTIPIVKLVTGPLDVKDVELSLNHILEIIRSNIDSDDFKNFKGELLTATYELNLVTSAKTGNKFGFAWLWVSSLALFHLLCGKNCDGSNAFRTEIVGDWVEPNLGFDIKKYNLNVDGPAKELFNSSGFKRGNWSDEAAFEDMLEEMTTPPTVQIPQSIIALPSKQLTDIQHAELINLARNEGKIAENVSKVFTMKVEAAFFNEDNCVTLKCSNVPEWVTEELLYPHFSKFNTDPNIYQHRTTLSNGEKKVITKTYPMIRFSPISSINKNVKDANVKCAYIQYSKHAEHINDAKGAGLMRKQLKITNKNGNTYNLIFFPWNPENDQQNQRTASHIPPKFSKTETV